MRTLREALEFYGDSKKYEARIINGNVEEGIVSNDGGTIAREAIANINASPDWRAQAEKLAEMLKLYADPFDRHSEIDSALADFERAKIAIDEKEGA